MKKDVQFKLADETPYFEHLGIKIIEAVDGYAKLTLDFQDRLTHPFGYLHGGAPEPLNPRTLDPFLLMR